MDPRRNTPKHIIITLPKIQEKERILKAARGKETVTYNGVSIRLSADFSKETLQTRRGWKEVFEVMKSKELHPRLLYPAKLSFKMEGQIRHFPNKVKLKEFIITKLVLYEVLRNLSKKKNIKTINNKTSTNTTINNRTLKKKNTKQRTRTGTES